MAAETETAGRPRIALYSHDTMGLGHVRRNLLLAQRLVSSPLQGVVLLIAGAREAAWLPIPPGVDCLTLPALRKEADGCYGSRSLVLSLPSLTALRRETIAAAVEAFDPDLFVVDNVPRGALSELDDALEALRRRRRTLCVLGLRDVLDDPAAVRREWDLAANFPAIRRFYEEVWVYGDPRVLDVADEYGFPDDVTAKVRYAGYLDQRTRLASSADQVHDAELARGPVEELSGDAPLRIVLCLVGGGQDGDRLSEAFARTELPPNTLGVILTGPFMAEEAQRRLRTHAAARSTLRVLSHMREPAPLIARADRVIAMGGYNTICEILSFDKYALVVPRIAPRREQLIRAQRLQAPGRLDVLHPEQVTPDALEAWLRTPRPRRDGVAVPLDGLANVEQFASTLLGTRSPQLAPR